MKLSERLKACRAGAGLTQVELAERAGVSQQLIGKLEKGEVLETRKLPQLARAFNMTVEEFLPDPWESGELGRSLEHARVADDERSVAKAFGKLIRERREAQGMTQTQLADWVGVTKGAISHWERGRVEGINSTSLHWLTQRLNFSDEELALFRGRPKLEFPELPPFPQSEMEIVHMYAALPENVRQHVREIIRTLSTQGDRDGQEARKRGLGPSPEGPGTAGQGNGRSSGREDHAEGSRSAISQGECGAGRVAEAAAAGSKEALGTESVSRLGAADHLKAGPAEVPVIAGSAPATGQLITIENAPKLSMRNREAILATDTVSCYCCIRTLPSEAITHWVDQQRTAFCPNCGVDSIIPGAVPTELLAAMCERWFIPQPGDEL